MYIIMIRKYTKGKNIIKKEKTDSNINNKQKKKDKAGAR